MMDFLLSLVLDASGADSGVGRGSLDLNMSQRVLEGFLDLGSTDQEGHRVPARAVLKLWISLGKVLKGNKISKEDESTDGRGRIFVLLRISAGFLLPMVPMVPVIQSWNGPAPIADECRLV